MENSLPRSEIFNKHKATIFLNSFIVSLLSLGYGLAVSSSFFISDFLCSNQQNKTILTVNTTALTSNTTVPNIIQEDNCINQLSNYGFNLLILVFSLITTYLHGYIKLKRKIKLSVAAACYSIGFFFCVFMINNIVYGLVGRVFTGIGIGLSSCLVIPYIVDNCPQEFKGFMEILTSTLTTVGILLNSVLNYFISNTLNLAILFFCYTLIYFFISFSCFCMPDKIRYKQDETDINSIKKFYKENIKKFCAVVLINLVQQFSFINGVIMFYSSVIADNNSIVFDFEPKLAVIILGAVNLVSNSVAIVLSMKISNLVNLFLFSQFMTAFTLLFLGLRIETLLFTYLFLISFSVGLGPLILPIYSKILERKHLAAGIKLGNCINFISAVLSLGLFGLIADLPQRHYIFYLGAGFLSITFILIYKLTRD